MATDVGYLRFIFYFGLIGLATFMTFFFKAMSICTQRLPQYRILFIAFLVINYLVWFKVATDIFLVFALFLCVSAQENEEGRLIELSEENQ